MVEAVLDDLTTEKVSLEQTGEQAGQGQFGIRPQNGSSTPVETPFLQMVMTRLWDEEMAAGSSVLRLQTYEALGRARNIARTHLDTMMAKLTEAECSTAANLLRFLVTPAGTKIAQEAGALASWSEFPEGEVQTILDRLSAPDTRILRTVQAPSQPSRYEIFHDVLAHAILDWRRRYVAQQEQERIRREAQERVKQERANAERRAELERARRLRRVIIGLFAILVVMAGLIVYAFRQKHQATRAYGESEVLKSNIAQKQKEIDDKRRELDC